MGQWSRKFSLVILITLILAGTDLTLGHAAAQPTTPVASSGPTKTGMIRGDPGRTGRQPGPGPAGAPRLAWTMSEDKYGNDVPVAAAGLLFLTNGIDNSVHAYDLATGAERWTQQTGRIYFLPAVVDGTLYVPSVNGLWALAAQTGQERWRIASSDPMLTGSDTFLLTAAAGSVYEIWGAVKDSDGSVRWMNTMAQSPLTGSGSTDQDDPIPVAIDGDALYVGAGNQLSIVDARTGAARGSLQVTGDDARPAVIDGILYVSTSDALYAVNAQTLRIRWRHPLNASVSAPAIGSGMVYVGGATGITALDAARGTVRWHFTGVPAKVRAIAGGMVIEETVPAGVDAPDIAVIGGTTSPPPAAFATPASLSRAPIPAVPCHVRPHSVAEIASLVASLPATPELGAGATPPEGATATSQLPFGVSASPAVTASVTTLLRQYIDCTNTGTSLQIAALYSDAYIRRSLEAAGVTSGNAGDVVAALSGPTTSPPPAERARLLDVRDVQRLPDGRVAAVADVSFAVIYPTDPQPGPVRTKLYFFVEVGGHWLLDDEQYFLSGAPGTSSAETARTWMSIDLRTPRSASAR